MLIERVRIHLVHSSAVYLCLRFFVHTVTVRKRRMLSIYLASREV